MQDPLHTGISQVVQDTLMCVFTLIGMSEVQDTLMCVFIFVKPPLCAQSVPCQKSDPYGLKPPLYACKTPFTPLLIMIGMSQVQDTPMCVFIFDQCKTLPTILFTSLRYALASALRARVFWAFPFLR